MVGTHCFVRTCQWAEDGAIYCGVRTSGIIAREGRGRFVVNCDGAVRSYPKADVEIELTGQYEDDGRS